MKTFMMLQKVSISKKWYSFELSIYQRILKNIFHGFHKNIKLFIFIYIENKNIFNIDKTVNHHIRVISEGSCDAEDAENSALITGIKYILEYINLI